MFLLEIGEITDLYFLEYPHTTVGNCSAGKNDAMNSLFKGVRNRVLNWKRRKSMNTVHLRANMTKLLSGNKMALRCCMRWQKWIITKKKSFCACLFKISDGWIDRAHVEYKAMTYGPIHTKMSLAIKVWSSPWCHKRTVI